MERAQIVLPAALQQWGGVSAPEVLAGEGGAELTGDNRSLSVHIPKQRRYVLVRWKFSSFDLDEVEGE